MTRLEGRQRSPSSRLSSSGLDAQASAIANGDSVNHGNISGSARALPRRITAGALVACLLSVGLSAPAQDGGRQSAHKQRARLELGAYGGYAVGGSAEGVSTLNSVRAD